MSGARPNQRATFLDGAVQHVLREGVATLSLRPLAAALGTSDRMLLYYFGTRENLLDAVLDAVAHRLRAGLELALPAEPLDPATLLGYAWTALDAGGTEPYMRLYVEISGLAARGREPFRSAAAAVSRDWLAWTAARLDLPPQQRDAAAAAVLAVLDGLLLVRYAAGDAVAASAAGWLCARLSGDERPHP